MRDPVTMILGTMLIGEPGREETARVTSPDGVVDAILIRINPGAFSGYLYHVHIVPKGAQSSGAPVLNGKHFVQEKLRWIEPHLLEVQYAKARVFHFGNLWYS